MRDSTHLKGHGNEADFLGFWHKSVRHRSLTLDFEPFDFDFAVVEIFVIEKRLPDSPSRGVDKNAYRYNCFQTFESINGFSTFGESPTRRVGESFFYYEYLREFEAKIGTARKVV